jgi:DNA polymerase epsilon subunit 1
MAKYCKCAGDFVNTLDIDEFAKKLKTFKGIAR